ncbi:serine/threonine protein kinase [Sorangium sp. So ce124]|uniref:serine/threonine protein kinase n=1 Tax=Sorangium sp. So ce124 TaxID=3133280 RepID=UPI003F6257CD
MSSTCRLCDKNIPPEAPGGLCPRCVINRCIDWPDATYDADNVPKSVDQYRLEGELGRGGMGVVYRAFDSLSGRAVALKMIRDGAFASKGARRQFENEIRAQCTFEHPNIVKIYHVGVHEGCLFFTMQLMAASTLADRRADFKDPRAAARLLEKLALAVHACHERKVLHRDLKPSNILFDENGEPHLADFGIAKRLDTDSSTATGMIVGTPCYMAPEQANGRSKEISAAADVWSLGVILYEMLVGRTPFAGEATEVLRRYREEEPPSPVKFRKDLPRDLSAVCLACLRNEPRLRYPSAAALAADLRRWLDNEPTLARPRGLPRRILWWCGRRRAVVGAVGAFALIVSMRLSLHHVQMQEQARSAALANNAIIAEVVADALQTEIKSSGRIVQSLANDTYPRRLLLDMNWMDLEDYCRSRQLLYGLSALSVLDEQGMLRAEWPPPSPSRRNASQAWRDYFRGAYELAAAEGQNVYVSRAFRQQAGQEFVLAISAPLRHEDGSFLGVVSATISLESRFDILRRIRYCSTTLVSLRDRDSDTADLPSPQDEDAILIHDGVNHSQVFPSGRNGKLRLLRSRLPSYETHQEILDVVETDKEYVDPVSGSSSESPGERWLAAFAPVGGTKLIVIVKTRRDALSQVEE